MSTAVYTSPVTWNAEKGIIKGNDEATLEKNKSLKFFESKPHKIYNALIEKDSPISPELLKKFNNEGDTPKTLLSAIQYHNTLLKRKIGVETTLAAYRKYESLRKKLVAFLSSHFERSDMFIKELNTVF